MRSWGRALGYWWAFLAEIEFDLRLEPIVLGEAVVRLRNSYDPVGRYWLSSVEVRVAFRERSFKNLPQIGHMLETSLLGAKKKREAGGSLSGNTVEEGMEVVPTEQSRSLTTSLLAQALVAATAGKQALAGLLALWRENSKGLAGYQWMDAWIGIAEKVFAASASEAVMTMVSEASTAEVRMLAATRVMSDADCSVDARFNAHVWIVCVASAIVCDGVSTAGVVFAAEYGNEDEHQI